MHFQVICIECNGFVCCEHLIEIELDFSLILFLAQVQKPLMCHGFRQCIVVRKRKRMLAMEFCFGMKKFTFQDNGFGIEIVKEKYSVWLQVDKWSKMI